MSETKTSLGEQVLGKLNIEHLMRKAATAETINDSISNSQLNRQQADKFIDLVVDTSVLLKSVRVARINFQSGEINKLDLGDIVSEDASATGTSTFAPTATKVDYDTKKVRSAFDITSDFTEDNIEGTSIRDKLLGMFTKRIAIDLEILALEGDSTNTAGTRKGRLLQNNDGYLKILSDNVPGLQQLDCEGANASAAMYYAMKNKVPSRYRVAGPDYRWIVPSRTWDKWNYDLTQTGASANGGTPNDTVAQYREMGGGGKPFGIPMVEVPLMPVDLAYTVGAQAFADGAKVILSPLMNLIFFIQRDITIEWDRVPRSDKWEVTIHTRNDFQVENRDMVILAKNVGVDGADYQITK